MRPDEDLLRESTLYAYHVPGINAIKVGFGSDGRSRMKDYSRQYRLLPSDSSLRVWKLPSPSIASSIESACHKALLCAGFSRLNHVVDEHEAKELFALGKSTYDEGLLIVADAIEQTITALHVALGKHKPLCEERARQQKDAAQKRRAALSAKREAQLAEVKKYWLSIAVTAVQQRWQKESAPFAKACDSAKEVYKEFPRSQGFISSIFDGKKSDAVRMLGWSHWPLIRSLIPVIFHEGRMAKRFYCEMRRVYGNTAELAAQELCLSIWSPGGYYLPLIARPQNENDLGFVEIRLVVQLATGMNGDNATEVIKSEPYLVELVKFAASNIAPELVSQ